MARKAWKYQIEKSTIYHVINRGIFRQVIFEDDEDYSEFLEIVKRYIEKEGVSVYHWCLMSNHYHLVLEMSNPKRLSKLIGAIQQVYAMKYHRKYKTAGRMFQNRFKSQAIEGETYLLACGRYVEQNPVRAKIKRYPWTWEWSSCKSYIKEKKDELTTKNPLWKDKDVDKYKEWVLQRNEGEEKLFCSGQVVVGDESRMIKSKGRMIKRSKGRPINDI
jgi:REP element-mobilizing transposase RayT